MATSKKITEMDALSSSYINSSYLMLPVVQPNSSSVPTNYKLPYPALLEKLQNDLAVGGSPYTPPALFNLFVSDNVAFPNTDYNQHNSQVVLQQTFVTFNDITRWFQLQEHGMYKISTVTSMRFTNSYVSTVDFPNGTNEFGVYLEGATTSGGSFDFNPFPSYANRSVHARYLNGYGYNASTRQNVVFTDEFYIDYVSNALPADCGRFRINNYAATPDTSGLQPRFNVAVSISKIIM